MAGRADQNKAIAERLGIGRVQVARWRERYLESGLQGIERDRPRGFKVSRDPLFAEKLEDIVGLHLSPPERVAAIDEYVAQHNIQPKPFIWPKSAADILQKVIRAHARLSSKQNATRH